MEPTKSSNESKTFYIQKINDTIKTVSKLKECIGKNGIQLDQVVLLGILIANQIEVVAKGLKGPQKLDLLLEILKIGIGELKDQIENDQIDKLLDFVDTTLPFTVQAAVAVGRHVAPNLETGFANVEPIVSCGCL
jgi:hypothetical protein